MKIAVLDIGGTSIKSAVYEDGSLTDAGECPTDAKKGGAHVMKTAIEILKNYSGFNRIGISTAGQVDPEKGIIKYANSNIPGYTGTKIKEILEKEFGVPAAVDNDVNAAAAGEAHFGAGKKYKDFICLTYGTGVGGAIVINGEVYKGSSFSAGEMGAVLIHPEDRNAKADMFSGCYERYASTTALVKKAVELDQNLMNGKRIFSAMYRPEIKEVIDSWIDEIVYGLISLIHIFNPSCVVLGGGIMKEAYILKEVKRKVNQNIMESFKNVTIVQAELGNTAGLYGAAYMALR